MSNSKNVAVTVSGLEPNHLYYYAFNGVGGNWPATLAGGTGVVAVDSQYKGYTIDASVQFCATTGSCYGSLDLLPYTIETTRQDKSDTFALLNFTLTDSLSNDIVLAKTVRVDCDNCVLFPKINVTYDNYLTSTNTSTISINLSDLVIGETYNYRFYGLDGNWPVMLSNISGTLVPTQKNNNIILSKLSFIESTGLYTGDNNKLIEPVDCVPQKDLYAIVYASISEGSSPSEPIKTENILVSCNDCLPILKIDTISDVVLSETNKNILSVNISNLHKNVAYNYMFHSTGGNSPVNITNISGSFIPNSSSYNLKSKITFCSSTGTCGDGSNSILNTNVGCLTDDDRYLSGYLYVESTSCSQTAVSNPFTITCNNCLQTPNINMGANAITTTQHYDLSTVFNNLSIGKTYNYSFVGSYSNWPVVIDPASGTFTALSDNETVNSKVVFCYPTGDAIGQPGLLNYAVNSLNQDYEYKFVKFRSRITESECSDITKLSNEFTLTCDGCLPCLNCSTIMFSGGPTISLPTGCCSGTDMMFVRVTGANPDNAYRYELVSLSGDISFVPSTGLVYVKNDGTSTIPLLMTTNLIDKEQALAQAKLINIDSTGEAVDYLALICGSGCNNTNPNI